MKWTQTDSPEQRMQQQWHDLVMAEQAGAPLEVLERMYDHYILLAEEYNDCKEPSENRRKTPSSPLASSIAGSGLSHRGKAHDARKAS